MITNYFKLLLASSIILISFGCKDDDGFSEEDVVDTYNIVSYKANIPVDLNNDKKSSTNLMDEIDILGKRENFLEVRPLINNVYFNFPLTFLNYDYPSLPDGYATFVKYGFATSTTLSDKVIVIKNNSYTENNYTGNKENIKNVSIENLKIIDNNRLSTNITKSYYDFSTKQWIELNIEVIFQKKL
ncbi:hypothetical protein [Empedobacter falsenii]|uniref:Uncharacterized protein n=1 Tax=Empedobacter falsenii TaxID=343874 RepID=A0A376GEY4_9FLAO|nr:hypothetical protein [Empedobacter falsenii]STD58711.1 Uncharacterised protein [Empedobacter falsenii]